MDREQIMAYAANSNDGMIQTFHQKMLDMQTNDPAKYDRLMTAMEARNFQTEQQLYEYIAL